MTFASCSPASFTRCCCCSSITPTHSFYLRVPCAQNGLFTLLGGLLHPCDTRKGPKPLRQDPGPCTRDKPKPKVRSPIALQHPEGGERYRSQPPPSLSPGPGQGSKVSPGNGMPEVGLVCRSHWM